MDIQVYNLILSYAWIVKQLFDSWNVQLINVQLFNGIFPSPILLGSVVRNRIQTKNETE